MIARYPAWPVCVDLVPGVLCLLIVIFFVLSAALRHDSSIADIELDSGLANVACKAILEFGSAVPGDLYAGKHC